MSIKRQNAQPTTTPPIADSALPNCIDCELPLTEAMVNHMGHPMVPEHKDRCCDCTDEMYGMPEKNRSRPRPTGRIWTQEDEDRFRNSPQEDLSFLDGDDPC
jgi:hypothetical protein